LKETLTEILSDSMERARADGTLPLKQKHPIQLEVPRDSGFGDFASNLAMILARDLKRPPREIANVLIDHLEDPEGLIDRCEIAGPGFINFYLREDYWVSVLKEIQSLGNAYGRSELGKGGRVLIEFVSANPTGPLHIGHGRRQATERVGAFHPGPVSATVR
jgi:arginyl-tRNA synthetase